MRFIKSIQMAKICLFFIFCGPLVALILWYAIAFLPYLSEIKSLSSRGNENIESIKDKFYPLAVAGETKKRIRSWAIQQAYVSLKWKNSPGNMLTWHANNLLWLVASNLHFNDHDIFGLWVECALYSCGSELESVAQKNFGKGLTDLSEIQLARLVALVKGPSMYALGSDKGEKRANEILEKVKAQKILD